MPAALSGARSRAAAGAGAAWFAVTATLLAGVAPLLLITATPVQGRSPWVWAWAISAAVGVRYAWLVAQGARRLFELVFWLFTYVFLGLAPLVQMRTATYPKTTPDINPELHGTAVAIIGGGALAFGLGAWIAGRLPPSRAAWTEPTVSTHRLVALSVLALAFTAYYSFRTGVGTLFTSRVSRDIAEAAAFPDATTRALATAAATLPLLVAFAGLMRLRAQRRSAGRTGPSILPWVVLVALVAAMNPVSSPRYVAGTAALAVVTTLGASSTVRRVRLFALLLAAGLVLVYPYADITRRDQRDTAELRQGPAQVLSSADFDAFDQVNNTVAYVRANGHTGGDQIKGALLFFVPRSVWPEKPEDTGIVLAKSRGYKVTNLSAPLWSELYLAGGWAVLLPGMAALGLFLRRLDLRIAGAGSSGRGPGVLAAILPFYMIIMLRGSLLQSMAGFTVLVVCGLFVTSRRRRSVPRPVRRLPATTT